MILFVMFLLWYIALSYIWAGVVQNTLGSGIVGFLAFVAPIGLFTSFIVLATS